MKLMLTLALLVSPWFSGSQAVPSCNPDTGFCKETDETIGDDAILIQTRSSPLLQLASSDGVSAVEAEVRVRDLVSQAVKNKEPMNNITRSALDMVDREMDSVIANCELSRKGQQKTVNQTQAAVAACHSDAETEHTKGDGIDSLATGVADHRNVHDACRRKEQSAKAERGKACAAEDSYAKGASPPGCMASYVAENTEASFKCLQEIGAWYKTTSDTWATKKELCRNKTEEHGTEQTTCNTVQGEFESGFCTYSYALRSSCDRQASCEATAMDSRANAYKETKELEEANKAEYRSAKTVKCIVDVFEAADSEKEDKLLQCSHTNVQDSHLDIQYWPDPQEFACDTSPVANKPCDAAWLGAEYAGKDWYLDSPPDECEKCTVHESVRAPVFTNPESGRAPVQWRPPQNTLAGVDGQLSKGGGVHAWDSGATSKQSADGDVTLQFTCSVKQHTMVGLAVGADTTSHYKDIDCAIYCDKGSMSFYERGSGHSSSHKYDENTQLSVTRVGTVVEYWKGSASVRKCAHALSGTVIADTSLHDAGEAGILTASWKTAESNTPVQWQLGAVIALGDNGKLFKTAGGNNWYAGATSKQSTEGDASLEVTASTSQHVMVGFSQAGEDSHNSYQDIDCAVYLDKGKINSYERGSHTYIRGTYDENTQISIRRTGTAVKYFKGSTELRTCRYQLNGKVEADSSIHDDGGGGLITAFWKSAAGQVPIQWQETKSVTLGSNGELSNSNGRSGWYGGAASRESTDGDVSLEFMCTTNQHTMIGLSESGSTHGAYTHYNDIDCAIYCDKGKLAIYEQGTHKEAGGSYDQNTQLSVKRSGTTVTYWKGSVNFGTCTHQLAGLVIADSSIHDMGVKGIISAFWNLDV